MRLLQETQDAPPRGIANFDSTTAFARANAAALRMEPFPRLGMIPTPVARLAPLANRLPLRIKQWIYKASGATEAIDPDEIQRVDVHDFQEWITSLYPDREYPAVLIGSPNGAATHLASLLQIPWLPQTFLTPVQRRLQAGAGRSDLEWGRSPGDRFLEANPHVHLARMHDPAEDRLMISRMAYFRSKLTRLGDAYETFLEDSLAPDGTLIVLDCQHEWPVTRIGERHTFQWGGLSGLTPDEFYQGSDRVDAFLDHQRTPTWDPPPPDDTAREAEWGFEPPLEDGIARFAKRHEHPLRALRTPDPWQLSPLVADLYRHHYETQGLDTNRLFAQSFALLEPTWTLRSASIPYWIPFNTDTCADTLEDYLERSEPYDQIRLNLISNGIRAPGQAPIQRWRSLLQHARDDGTFQGTLPDKHPIDLATYVDYHEALPDQLPHGGMPPNRLRLPALDDLMATHAKRYGVTWQTA